MLTWKPHASSRAPCLGFVLLFLFQADLLVYCWHFLNSFWFEKALSRQCLTISFKYLQRSTDEKCLYYTISIFLMCWQQKQKVPETKTQKQVWSESFFFFFISICVKRSAGVKLRPRENVDSTAMRGHLSGVWHVNNDSLYDTARARTKQWTWLVWNYNPHTRLEDSVGSAWLSFSWSVSRSAKGCSAGFPGACFAAGFAGRSSAGVHRAFSLCSEKRSRHTEWVHFRTQSQPQTWGRIWKCMLVSCPRAPHLLQCSWSDSDGVEHPQRRQECGGEGEEGPRCVAPPGVLISVVKFERRVSDQWEEKRKLKNTNRTNKVCFFSFTSRWTRCRLRKFLASSQRLNNFLISVVHQTPCIFTYKK